MCASISTCLVMGIVILALSALPMLAQRSTPVRRPGRRAKKTVCLMAIGNSFSNDATKYLSRLAEAGGHKLVFGHAMIGGCSLEKHWRLAQKHEADADDPEGRPYQVRRSDGSVKSVSLKELLQSRSWQYVTIQQVSNESYKVTSYRPYARKLADYVRQHAPQAELVIHETWEYRVDHPLYSEKRLTPERMYEGLHSAYAKIAGELGVKTIIPVGSAFQNTRNDPRWVMDIELDVDRAAFQPPALPRQVRSLWVGYYWSKKTNPPSLGHDGKHASTAGRYLGAAVWYEVFFGDVREVEYVPRGLAKQDAVLLREIAHKTVRENRRAATQPARKGAK